MVGCCCFSSSCASSSSSSLACLKQQRLSHAPSLSRTTPSPHAFVHFPCAGRDPRQTRARQAMGCGRQPVAQLMEVQVRQAEEALDRNAWHGLFERNWPKDEGKKRESPARAEEARVVEGSPPSTQTEAFVQETSSSGEDELWLTMRSEARRDAEAEPALASFLYSTILAHRSLYRALAFHLGNKLASTTLLSTHLVVLILDTFTEDAEIRSAVRADIIAVKERDPACVSYSHCMLNFKGFLACQAYRVAHRLWTQGRNCLALVIQSRVSEEFHVDIHPAAKIGSGILFDHATGVVVGETAVIGNNVSILHNVTLGGTGAFGCDRHPKIGDGVLVGAGAILLGPIRIGEGAKIGAGSVVLTDVPPHTTAVGNPARLFGGKRSPKKLREIPSQTMDHTSFIESWSDYII